MVKKIAFVVLALALGLFFAAGCNMLKGVNLKIPGNVAGQITNEGGQGQGFMSVKLVNAKTNEEVQVVTAEDTGNFFFEKVDPGDYVIKLVDAGGTEMPSDAKQFKLGPGKTLTIPIILKSKETQAGDSTGGQ